MALIEYVVGSAFLTVVLAIVVTIILPILRGNCKGILLNEMERTLRFIPLKKHGKLYVHKGTGTAYMPHYFWNRERWFGLKVIRYLILRDSDPRPLAITEGSFVPVPMDSAMLSGAIHSDIVTRFLKGGMDWRIIVIVVLIFVVIVTAIT